MNILSTIIAILLLLGLIAVNVFIFIVGDIDKFIEELEKKYEDKWFYERRKEYYEVMYEV